MPPRRNGEKLNEVEFTARDLGAICRVLDSDLADLSNNVVVSVLRVHLSGARTAQPWTRDQNSIQHRLEVVADYWGSARTVYRAALVF